MSELIGIGLAMFFILVFGAVIHWRQRVEQARFNRRYDQYRDRGIEGFDYNEDFGNRRD